MRFNTQSISTVFLTPSGLGHQIDFAALPINDKQTLGEKYKLHILKQRTVYEMLKSTDSLIFNHGNDVKLQHRTYYYLNH